MTSKIWIQINRDDKKCLKDWIENIHYELDDDVVYKVDFTTIEQNEFIENLKMNNINYEIILIEYKFNKKDIEKSEILDLSLDGKYIDSERFDNTCLRCECCGTKIPRLDEAIMVDYDLFKNRDIIETYPSNYSVIVSEKVKNIISLCDDRCVEYFPIFDLKSKRKIEGYFKLVLKIGVDNAVKPTIIVNEEFCECCGFFKKHLLKSVLYFDKET